VIQVHATGDVEEYAAAAEPFLRADPCARNVLLTIIQNVRAAATGTYSGPPSFWWITDSDTVVGAASWTPPYNLLVSSLPTEAAPGLARAAVNRAIALGLRPLGVVGPAESARVVAEAWTEITDDTIERDRTILLNVLGSLVEVPMPPGARRPARPDDVPVIAAWLEVFSAEIEHAAPANAHAMATRMVHGGQVDVWIDRDIVCMVGYRDASGVLRVGPVYTPPEHRNHGYARRLTYEVTQEALQRPGIDRAMLFTDADNPVSNSIYRQAGYEPRGEHVEIDFAERAAEPLESAP
jgi:predicted GNAT family acetyltransferase